jgi:hypothetical protein
MASKSERPKKTLQKSKAAIQSVQEDCACTPSEAATATCLDQKSGLYHPQHFFLSLNYEFNRMERTEKPLGLIILQLSEAKETDFQKLGSYLKSNLRPLDLAANLGPLDSAAKLGQAGEVAKLGQAGEVAILIPEADRDRAVRLIKALGQEYLPGGKLSGPKVIFGAALARPYQGWRPDDLVQKARENSGPALEAAEKVISGASPWTEVDTALAGPERDSLFSGFGSLSVAPSPGRRSSAPK